MDGPRAPAFSIIGLLYVLYVLHALLSPLQRTTVTVLYVRVCVAPVDVKPNR